jgi:hypothetical protein
MRRWSESLGGRSVTSGLSSVGPPPGFMMIQLLATLMMHGFSSSTTCPPSTSAWNARERATSLTVRKWVSTSPSWGAGGSSLFIAARLRGRSMAGTIVAPVPGGR